MKKTIPDQTLQSLLRGIEKPGRYCGGEYGAIPAHVRGTLITAVSYPDLYEIGMSNNAVRILYGMMNAVEGIVCERVFAPAPDMEESLVKKKVPLYTLESRYPLSELDILAYSIGYELTLTSLLTILDRGGIPLENRERGRADPIILAGGPATINPAPYGPFIDAIWIGESEEILPSVLSHLVACKKQGGTRDDFLHVLADCPQFWMKGWKEEARRGVWNGFGCIEGREVPAFMPVPSIRTVQAQGVVEIMRGCPHGCRFCNAGSIYKPVREKEIDQIVREIDTLVFQRGLREITLSSLSSGDYSCIQQLLNVVNSRYEGLHISFSLPSLKVDTFTLGLLEGLSKVRKSGLTFAVETPEDPWQRAINKQVGRDKIIRILREAKTAGWKLAKFYFMIGLPVQDAPGDDSEIESIISFIDEVQREVRLSLNVNIGVFVPKPHTPFQWARQLSDSEAFPQLATLKNAFRRGNVKVNYHSPFLSLLEGIVSRGDERSGELYLASYRKGARLDAWEEYLNRDAWSELIKGASWDVIGETCRERTLEENLPWDTVDMGISKKFLQREYKNAVEGKETPPCAPDCSHNCGVCREQTQVRKTDERGGGTPPVVRFPADPDESYETCLFGFQKQGTAVYMAHLDVLRILEHAFQRAGVFIRFTEGFNPKPRLEFAHPLALGIASEEEIGLGEVRRAGEPDTLVKRLNDCFPAGFVITRMKHVDRNPEKKRRSLMSLYWGAEYALDFSDEADDSDRDIIAESLITFINSSEPHSEYYGMSRIEKGFLLRVQNKNRKEAGLKYLLREIAGVDLDCPLFSLRRTKLFADNKGEPADYFDIL